MVLIAPAGVSLSGRVTDAQGGAVADANVRVGREDGTSTRHAVTNGSGEYRVDDLTPGVFIVEIERAGFRRRTEVRDARRQRLEAIDARRAARRRRR